GIDYFSGFDVNHIAFAMHGKNPETPLSAGMYKTKDSKDISVKIAEADPNRVVQFESTDTFKKDIQAGKTENATNAITNASNVFVKNRQVTISSDTFTVTPNQVIIDYLAPYQSKEISVSYGISTKIKGAGDITIAIGNDYKVTKYIAIASQSFGTLWYTIALVLIICILISLYNFVRKSQKKIPSHGHKR
ncbi:MAG: hypothetical protein ACMG6E_06490, partial [Candidatus Roizmanbacteria bacterium]